MMRRIVGDIPTWMRADHPVLRYVLQRRSQEVTSGRYTRAFFQVLLAGLFLLIGYANVSNLFEDNPFELPFSQLLIELLFWPTLILQLGLQLTVLLTTINTISENKRRQMWDSVRTTTQGAALTIRTRWSAVVFYRIRDALVVLIGVRVLLIGGMLFDLTAFEGDYLGSLTRNITPEVSLPVGVLLLALMMTASLLLPLTTLGFDAAFGLLVSTVVQQRTYVVLTQVILTVIRVALIAGLVLAVESFRVDTLDMSNLLLWLLLLGFAVIGDWGISFLYIGFFGAQVWEEVPYGILLGVGMMVYVIVQAVMTDLVLAWAIRRAERSE